MNLGTVAVLAQNVVRGSQMRPRKLAVSLAKLAVRAQNVVRGSQMRPGKLAVNVYIGIYTGNTNIERNSGRDPGNV